MIFAIQMVYEQSILVQYNVNALTAAGWEGLFGLLAVIAVIVPLSFVKTGKSGAPFVDVVDAFIQLSNNFQLLGATVLFCASITFLRVFGLMVGKRTSATTRVVIDSLRNVGVWSIAMLVGWEQFQALQLVGFALLVGGIAVYYEVGLGPWLRDRFAVTWLARPMIDS